MPPPTRVIARAPGKVAVLGEYAVLGGAPALVLAVERRCVAEIERAPGETCRLETRYPAPDIREFPVGRAAGSPLIDAVRAEVGQEAGAWRATLDSSEFFAGALKLGLGSSAAALVAFAGAWARWTGAELPSLERLVELHRRFQGGAGSGLDVAASRLGGAIEFRLDTSRMPQVGSVQLPNSVGFAGIFSGRSASTPDLLARYRKWCADRPAAAGERQRTMERIAEAGCAAARGGESEEFLRIVDLYGHELEALGRAMGAEIVTAEHRRLGQTARRLGVTYKVSGAGGGDLGVALAGDRDALDAFKRAAAGQGFDVLDMNVARHGLVVEEQAQ